jgi:hypothetical protein
MMMRALSMLPFAAALAALGYDSHSTPSPASMGFFQAGRSRQRKPHQGVIRTYGLKYLGHIPLTFRDVKDGKAGAVQVNGHYVKMRFHPLGGLRTNGEDGRALPVSEDAEYRKARNARKRARRAA